MMVEDKIYDAIDELKATGNGRYDDTIEALEATLKQLWYAESTL